MRRSGGRSKGYVARPGATGALASGARSRSCSRCGSTEHTIMRCPNPSAEQLRARAEDLGRDYFCYRGTHWILETATRVRVVSGCWCRRETDSPGSR